MYLCGKKETNKQKRKNFNFGRHFTYVQLPVIVCSLLSLFSNSPPLFPSLRQSKKHTDAHATPHYLRGSTNCVGEKREIKN